jgi:sulfur-oxidizing protein SoxY
VVGSGTPLEERMMLELPEDAENGSIVPYKISVESPMTADDYIARVDLLSTQNPQASVATFHFTPLSGTAAVTGRMRLAKTQEVVAVALTSSNKLLMARQTVNVGIGGCGTE